MVKCDFEINSDDNYCCKVEDEKFPTEVNRETFQGKHSRSKSNVDVNWLDIQNSEIEKIPNGLGKVFENLTWLIILNSNLKTISKEDFKQFPRLEFLNVEGNHLESLPKDLFEFNKDLEEVWFNCNKIKYIGVEIFDELPKFKFATFCNNVNINIMVQKNNQASIEKFKQIVLTKCQQPKKEEEKIEQPKKEKPTKSQLDQKCPLKHLKKIHVDFEKFLKVEEFKDFSIKVAAAEFKVHKFIFAARSETFAEMIKNNPDADELVLEDIPVEIFESILNYVYKDEMPKNLERTREIFAAAGKLKIEGLKENLTEILIQKMNEEKNLDFLMENLNLGIKFECKDLKLKAFEEIKKHFPGKKLKDELLEQPKELKKLIDTKKMLDEQLKKFQE